MQNFHTEYTVVLCFESHLIAALQCGFNVCRWCHTLRFDAKLLRALAFSYLLFPLPSSIQNHSSESTLRPVQKTYKIRWNLQCFTKCNGAVIWQSLAFHFPFVFKLLNWVSRIPDGNHGNLLKVSLRVYLLTGWESCFLWHWETTHCQSIDAQPTVFLQGLKPLARA